MFKSLDQVDWDLLHRQKLALLGMLEGLPSSSPAALALQGLVHLLDALQDDAAAAGRWTFPSEPAAPGVSESPPLKRHYVEDDDGHHRGPLDDKDEAAGFADQIHGRIIAEEVERPPVEPDMIDRPPSRLPFQSGETQITRGASTWA